MFLHATENKMETHSEVKRSSFSGRFDPTLCFTATALVSSLFIFARGNSSPLNHRCFGLLSNSEHAAFKLTINSEFTAWCRISLCRIVSSKCKNGKYSKYEKKGCLILPAVVSQQQSLAARTGFGRIMAAKHGGRGWELLLNWIWNKEDFEIYFNNILLNQNCMQHAIITQISSIPKCFD